MSETAILKEIVLHEREIDQAMESAPMGASVPTDDVVTAMIELGILRDDLRELRGDSSDPDPSALMGVPLEPKPYLHSGGIALPEPEFEAVAQVPPRLVW